MSSPLTKIKEELAKAKKILVFLSPQPSFDALASALGLHLTLRHRGFSSTVATTYVPTAGDSHLIGINTLSSEIGNENLLVSFPYIEEAVDKVSYEVNGDTFNLIIKPKKGHQPIDKQTITLSYAGATADLIFLVGASTKEEIGALLTQENSLATVPTAIINTSPSPLKDAIQFVDPKASLSEITTAFLAELQYPLTQDAAQNLLLGIEHATNSLTSPNITADTFEALAVLYRAGARRKPSYTPSKEEKESANRLAKNVLTNQTSPSSPQPDWLKPKIYKSSSLPKA